MFKYVQMCRNIVKSIMWSLQSCKYNYKICYQKLYKVINTRDLFYIEIHKFEFIIKCDTIDL